MSSKNTFLSTKLLKERHVYCLVSCLLEGVLFQRTRRICRPLLPTFTWCHSRLLLLILRRVCVLVDVNIHTNINAFFTIHFLGFPLLEKSEAISYFTLKAHHTQVLAKKVKIHFTNILLNTYFTYFYLFVS